jgi:NAD(P)-dependent dehydrogenase (short-subunit alcohol dehydrogenase family)
MSQARETAYTVETILKLLLITGGIRGIGAGTARLAAQRGYAVCVNYLQDRAAAMQVVTAMEDEAVRLFETVDRELGGLTALVNRSGACPRSVDDRAGGR